MAGDNTRQYHGIQIVVDGHEVGRVTSFVPIAGKHYNVLVPREIPPVPPWPSGYKVKTTTVLEWYREVENAANNPSGKTTEPDHVILTVTGENPDAWPPFNCTMTIQHPGGPEEPIKSLEVTESDDWIVEMPDGKIWRYCGVTAVEKEMP